MPRDELPHEIRQRIRTRDDRTPRTEPTHLFRERVGRLIPARWFLAERGHHDQVQIAVDASHIGHSRLARRRHRLVDADDPLHLGGRLIAQIVRAIAGQQSI
jgi:hypothetical protein